MSQQQIIHHKRTATFGYIGTKVMPAGNWSAVCKARDTDGAVVQDFDVGFDLDGSYTPPTPTLQRYIITIRASAVNVKTWTAGDTLKADVAFYDDSTPPTVVPTDSFVIRVIEGQSDVV